MLSALELVGVLISVPSFLGFLYALYLAFRTNWHAFQQYQESLEKTRKAFNNLLVEHNGLLQDLHSCRESLPQSAYDIGSIPSFNLSRIHMFIHNSFTELDNMGANNVSRNYVSRFLYSKFITCQCLQLEALAQRLTECIQRMRAYCPLIIFNAHHTHTAQKFMDDLRATGHSCDYMIQTHNTNARVPNAPTVEPPHPPMFQFKSAVYTAKNPSYVMLDFSGRTPEARLKNRILYSGDEIPDIFGSRKIVLEGQKGSGKTCIMRGLRSCQDIQARFTGPGKGGIYSITVGRKPDSADIKEQMSKIVDMSGGWHLRERMLQENVSAGVLVMAEWFMDKDTLFLVDEVDDSPFARALEDQLETLSRTNDSSVVVFSRRVARNSNDDVVHVPSGDEFGAEEWLLRLLEINPKRQMKRKPKAAFNKIISLCSREKRLLGQVSVCYKQICQNRMYESAWQSLEGRLWVFIRDKRNVEVALTALLLDLMKPQIDSAFPGSQSIQRLYRAFQVVRVKGWISLDDLRKEWKLGLEEYMTVQRILVDGRFCQITERLVGHRMVEGVEVDGFWCDSMQKACMHEEVVIAA